jgi:hypothetical protein
MLHRRSAEPPRAPLVGKSRMITWYKREDDPTIRPAQLPAQPSAVVTTADPIRPDPGADRSRRGESSLSAEQEELGGARRKDPGRCFV